MLKIIVPHRLYPNMLIFSILHIPRIINPTLTYTIYFDGHVHKNRKALNVI